ncbi:MAG: hypothetical protein PHP54_00890 [Clostridia bacterium]|nr:hypothetical protein [Clostridia bacterium]
MIHNKKGNIELVFLSIIFTILIIILMSFYFLSMQINAQVYPIKQDLFYLVQNSYLSMDIEELAYNNYIIDEDILRNKIQNLISKNHKNVVIESLQYDQRINKVKIRIKVTIKPIILKKQIGNIMLTIYDEIKLKTMDVNY